jgi:hypothetical protein
MMTEGRARPARRGWRAGAAALLAGVCAAAGAEAQQAGAPPPPQGRADSVTVVAGPEYDAGGLYALLFGRGRQELWQTPVRVPVLDLSRHAGGLTPTEAGGGKQTKSLRFRGGDGREYQFRSVKKDLYTLPADLRRTFAGKVVRDQLKSHHPAGPVVAAPLIGAAGVLHPVPVLVVMPDDPRLGEFRAEFAGMLGTIEERPNEGEGGGEGFAGAERVIGTPRLLERIEEGPDDVVDARAFLDARLTDLFLGDWDRHQDQWRWAAFGEGTPRVWKAVPRDRDQAFVHFDGLVLHLVRSRFPRVVRFGPTYRDKHGLTFSARDLDRRLLSSLERPAWDSAVVRLQAAWTDAVIDDAIARMPPEWRAKNGDELRRDLRGRRDRLGEAADWLYRRLAHEAEVHTTDEADRAVVERLPSGDVVLSVETGGRPAFRRTFRGGETKELRVYLHGGDDAAVVRGSGARMKIRLVGGGGDDVLADSSRASGGRRTRFYDDRGDNTFALGGEADVSTRSFEAPEVDPDAIAAPWRDWGEMTDPVPWAGYRTDLGVILGGGVERIRYGFRQVPYSSRVVVRARWAWAVREGAVEYVGDFRRPASPTAFLVRGLASGLELTRFHGYGNDAPLLGDDEFHRARTREVRLEVGWRRPLFGPVTGYAGPAVRYADTPDDEGFLALAQPYGVGRFGQAGARAELAVDTRDHRMAPTRGIRAALGGSAWPRLWDVEDAFGEAHVDAATYLTAPIVLRPTLALRAGGKRVWGDAPFHEAAFVGGQETVRGFREQRFAGDAALWGNAELRLKLFDFAFLIPGTVGVHGMADAGRVYVDGESPGGWHTSHGGGVWLRILDDGPAVSLTVARGEETRVYAGAGFQF